MQGLHKQVNEHLSHGLNTDSWSAKRYKEWQHTGSLSRRHSNALSGTLRWLMRAWPSTKICRWDVPRGFKLNPACMN